MDKNILGFGYEELLQPSSALSSKHKSKCNNVACGAKELRAAQIKFFGLDCLFQPDQKVR